MTDSHDEHRRYSRLSVFSKSQIPLRYPANEPARQLVR